MSRELLVGAWRLVSFVLRSTNSEVSHPFGRDAVGYLMYTEHGYMSVAIMAANRPTFSGDDIMGGSTDEQAAAARTYLSYCGRYDVAGENIVHHLEVSFFPNWTGGDQQRHYKIDGDTLMLRASPQVLRGKEQSAELIWERL